jgi:hypothetical protein
VNLIQQFEVCFLINKELLMLQMLGAAFYQLASSPHQDLVVSLQMSHMAEPKQHITIQQIYKYQKTPIKMCLILAQIPAMINTTSPFFLALC